MLRIQNKKLLILLVLIGIVLCLLPYLLLFPSSHDAIFSVVSADAINPLINISTDLGALIIGIACSAYFLRDKKLPIRIVAVFVIAFVVLQLSSFLLNVFNAVTTGPLGPF
jgi:hypothetical protein